ncbi:MAG: EamA family transporter [Parcubacteria group bacterium]|jgi:drug/metabolite transporter (DMT)-like permease
MNWLAISTVAYFLLALEVVLDKFLLSSRRVSHPAIYTFYAGALGLFALFFIPFGVHALSYSDAFLRFVAGVIFIYGMFSLFSAIAKSEASRVVPVVGVVVPILALFLAAIFLNEHLKPGQITGIFFLVIGGLWISYDLTSVKKIKLFDGFYWSILAGTLLAISAVTLKGFYSHDNFINVYVWRVVGSFFGVLTLLFVPRWRKVILASVFKFKEPEREHKKSGLLFVMARAIGGGGSILKEYATSLILASVTIVNAIVAIEYVFVFILGVLFSLWFPGFFEEKRDARSTIQKISAILIIAIGVFLVSKR